MSGPRFTLDIQAVQNPEYRDRGIGRFVTEHALALLDSGAPVAALLLNPARPFPTGLHPRLQDSGLLRWSTATTFASLGDSIDVHHVMSPIEMTAPIETVLPPFVRETGAAIAVTLYDLIPLSDPARYLPTRDDRQRYATRLEVVKAADHVLCISEFTRARAIEALGVDPPRATSIGAGVSAFFASGEPAGLARAVTTREFIMSVTGGDERKNTERLIEAYARLPHVLRRQFQLVVACDINPHIAGMWRQRGEDCGLESGDLLITGRVDDDALRDLYRCARLFVFPSRAEGFGLPLAEAAACGCPAVSSNATSIPEVLEMPDATFDPLDVPAITASIERGLTDEAFRLRLRDRGLEMAGTHRWERVARRTLDAVRVTRAPRRASTTRRLRVALVGPLPPIASGVADYTAHVLEPLSRRVTLDVFATPGSDLGIARRAGAARALPLSLLRRVVQPTSYDTIVYCMGNSEAHHAMLAPLTAEPGVLWMHDARLHGFYLSYALTHEADPRSYLRALLTRATPAAPPDELLGDDWSNHEAFTRSGLGLTGELVRQATGVIVHSDAARELLVAEQGGDASPLMRVVPLAVPPAPRSAAREPGLIVSAGFCAPEKAPEVAIEALALLRQHQQARLAFVGPADPATRDALVRQAERAGVDAHVTFTGRLAAESYWDWLARADCALQLRRTNYGEMSGAVNDCLAARTPVVTNVPSYGSLAADNVVQLVDEALRPAEIAAALGRMTNDGPSRAVAYAAIDDYARDHDFDAMADDVVQLLTEVVARDALGYGAIASA